MKSFHFDRSSVKHLPNFKYEKPSTILIPQKKKREKFVMKSVRGDDRDQIPLLLSYQSHRWPETHKT